MREATVDQRNRALLDAVAVVESCRDGYAMAIGASPEPPVRYWVPRDAVIKAIEALIPNAPAHNPNVPRY